MDAEEEVGRLLQEKGWTLAVAESCTGGLIGHRLTSVGGSSNYFVGGVIAYSNMAKRRLLGVSQETLEREGAVSEAVARQMAAGIRQALGADVGVGVTGIAGPSGGTVEKPVGLVFIGMAWLEDVRVERFEFCGDRAAVKTLSSEAALNMIQECLRQKKGDENG